MTAKVRPFSSGTQYIDWRYRNCERCAKFYWNLKPSPANGQGPCDIDNAISSAAVDDGTVSAEIAEKMGFQRESYGWDCPVRETMKGG